MFVNIVSGIDKLNMIYFFVISNIIVNKIVVKLMFLWVGMIFLMGVSIGLFIFNNDCESGIWGFMW